MYRLGSVFREMLDVCRNPTYLLVVCAFAAEMALLSAFVVFGAKFFENVFQFSKESASVFFGTFFFVTTFSFLIVPLIIDSILSCVFHLMSCN